MQSFLEEDAEKIAQNAKESPKSSFHVASPPPPPKEIGFKKDRHKHPAKKTKKRRPVNELLRVLRSNRCCLLALGLDDSAQDMVIIQALLRVDEKVSFFRNAGASEEVAKHIAQLFEAGLDDITEYTSRFLRRAWLVAIQLLVVLTVFLVIAAVVVFVSALDWVRGLCQFSDFTNGTCNHGNDCRLQVATQTEEGIAYVNNFALPVVSNRDSSLNGLKIFDANGAFRCCNYAQHALEDDAIPQAVYPDGSNLGVGFGSGTPFCNFYNSRFKVFCDNFGLVPQFSHCPMSPWACRLFSEIDPETGQKQVVEVKVWEEPWTIVLVLCACGVFVLNLMLIAFGYACKHSDRLYALGIRLSFAWERWQQRVRLRGRLRACCLRMQRSCLRALRLPTGSQDRALRREEKQRQLMLLIEQQLKEEEEAELELQGVGSKGSKDEPPMFTLRRGNLREEKEKREREEAARATARKKLAAKQLRKMFRNSRKKKASNLRILENDGNLPPPGQDPASTGDSFYSASSSSEEFDNQIHPWNSEEVLEEDVEEEPNSRPATKNLQSMLRPIMTPMQPQRSPRYVSKKFGWQDFSSTTNSFATATSYRSYGTDTLGASSMASSMSGFGRGDAMAQTFSEGFGQGGVSRPKKKRRVQDGKSRRGKARAAWQSPDRKSMGRQMNESFTSSIAW